jgi:hypothetical protein
VQEDFGVAHQISFIEAEAFDEAVGDVCLFDALDPAALFADEMRVLMRGGRRGVAERVAPGAIFAADAVDEPLAREAVERAIDRDRVGVLTRNTPSRTGVRRKPASLSIASGADSE